MRKILAIGFATYLLSSCSNTPEQIIVKKSTYDSLERVVENLNFKYKDTFYESDSIKTANDSLKSKNKRLKDHIFDSDYKIEKVRYYLKIVDKNPTQIKYLKGWCYRAIK